MNTSPGHGLPVPEDGELDVDKMIRTATDVVATAGEALGQMARVLIEYGYERGRRDAAAQYAKKPTCRCSRGAEPDARTRVIPDPYVRMPQPLRQTLGS